MKLLLDTHILLWWVSKDRHLPTKAWRLIENSRNDIIVSSASIWEVAVKRALGKLGVDLLEMEEAIVQYGFEQLSVTTRHAIEVASLPTYHNDPFDRMLVAQCIVETAYLLTHDATLSKYGKMVLVV